MASGMQTIIYPVEDIAAKNLYATAFGVEPYVDEPYYVAFNVGGQDVGLDPNGHAKGMTGPVPYWRVDTPSSDAVLSLRNPNARHPSQAPQREHRTPRPLPINKTRRPGRTPGGAHT